MADMMGPKTVLQHYLQRAREALVWKLDGLSEREARRPHTPTGTNLLGLVKHCINVEAGYFGPTFGREFPTPGELVPLDDNLDPQTDWYATQDETKDGLLDLYRRVWAFGDQTIADLPLDAPGMVPWWPAERRQVTLQRIIVHVTYDVSRHAGHADILREQYDGAAGYQPGGKSMPETYDWAAYLAKLSELAERFD